MTDLLSNPSEAIFPDIPTLSRVERGFEEINGNGYLSSNVQNS